MAVWPSTDWYWLATVMNRINYSKRRACAVVELDRPDKLNAIDADMRQELCTALDLAATDDSVHVLQLRGRGRAFSAGFDLDMGEPPEGTSESEHIRAELEKDFDLIMRFMDFSKPTVVAVHGYCLGSALELSAVCDITIASDDCLFGVPELKYGSGIVCMILPWIIGQKNARELVLTGADDIDAARALAMGLVNRVVSRKELRSASDGIADEIALNDPFAVRLTKKAINRGLELAGMREALRQALEIDCEIETGDSDYAREFNRILGEEGLKAALAWRRSAFDRGANE